METVGFTPGHKLRILTTFYIKRKEPRFAEFFSFGGDGGIRTHDLSDANRTLSQLSYAPKCILLYHVFLKDAISELNLMVQKIIGTEKPHDFTKTTHTNSKKRR